AQRIFDAELALANCARFAAALANTGADPTVREHGKAALTAVLGDDWQAEVALLRGYRGPTTRATVLARRLGASIEGYGTARQRLAEAIEHRLAGQPDTSPDAVFTPAVELTAGFLPGSVAVSAAASTTPGRGGLLDRSAMPPYLRAAIQVAVATSIAIVIGDAVSGSRLYWAVLATFLAFMATTNSGEQARKALFRVTGTAIGIVLGDLLVRVTGGHVWSSLLIVLVALFFGIYLIRVNYTFMVIGITVTISQLYAQLGEFSWNLLLLRLGETAIGVGAVMVTVLLIVPLRPQRVLTAGVLLWFRALSTVIESSLDRLTDGDAVALRPAVRELDAAYAALEATAAPLRTSTFGRNSAQLSEISSVSAAARSYARSLAVEAESVGSISSPPLRRAAAQLRESLAAIDNRIATGQSGEYLRAASLIELASQSVGGEADSDAELAQRDLTLLDGALARLAAALQMAVRDHDTTETQTPAEPIEAGRA
ncbi:MAG: Fusaric acid resistance protein-like, partial [Frankiales bacterium]|nr:Fusaric acid resistance protein-like [Frankiales bacterium]